MMGSVKFIKKFQIKIFMIRNILLLENKSNLLTHNVFENADCFSKKMKKD